jgi:hypothetical protein
MLWHDASLVKQPEPLEGADLSKVPASTTEPFAMGPLLTSQSSSLEFQLLGTETAAWAVSIVR